MRVLDALPRRVAARGGVIVLAEAGLETWRKHGVCVWRVLRSGFGSSMIFESTGSSKASMRVASEVSLNINTGVLYIFAMRAASIAM